MLAHTVGEFINSRILGGLDLDPHEILRCVLVEKFWSELWLCVWVKRMKLMRTVRTLPESGCTEA
jgi:hypothetical protein